MPSIHDNDLKPLSLEDVSTYPLDSRPSKISLDDFASPIDESSSLTDFLNSLPNILAVQNLRELAGRIRNAKRAGKPIIWGLGGHVIKVGLAPVIIDLMRRGFVTAIAANGSVLVHDAEIAMVGSTSEDVDATLGEGAFGAAEETGQLLNSAAREGMRDGIGLGEARRTRTISPKAQASRLLPALRGLREPDTLHCTHYDWWRHCSFSSERRRSSSREQHRIRISVCLRNSCVA